MVVTNLRDLVNSAVTTNVNVQVVTDAIDGLDDTIADKLSGLASTYDTYKNALESVADTFEDDTADMKNALQTDISTVHTDFIDIQSQIADLNTDIGTLVDGYEGEITAHYNTIVSSYTEIVSGLIDKISCAKIYLESIVYKIQHLKVTATSVSSHSAATSKYTFDGTTPLLELGIPRGEMGYMPEIALSIDAYGNIYSNVVGFVEVAERMEWSATYPQETLMQEEW